MAISFGLESHIFGMKPDLFWKIISNDVPGPNVDPAKAERVRTFLIPEEYIVEGSSPRRPRTVKIFAAIVSDKWVLVLTDFVGLVRMHIKSQDAIWTERDFAVGSPVPTLLPFTISSLSNFFFGILDVVRPIWGFQGGC